jgi:hypothetical protein
MSSLLTAGQKSLISATFDDIHDTFLNTGIVVYRRVAVEQTGSSYNSLYGRNKDGQISPPQNLLTGIPASGRVQYMNMQDESDLGDGLNINSSEGMVRLKVDAANLANIQTAERVGIDNFLWTVASDPKPLGPFNKNYFMIYLKREN